MNPDTLLRALDQVRQSVVANWPFLLASAVIASALRLSLDRARLAAFLRRHRRGGVVVATAAAVATPLCSCGTTAVALGMMAGSLPWGPVVAFMVASPLTSPGELLIGAGLFGWRFAVAFLVASIVLGLLGGLAAHALEARGWLDGQARVRPATPTRASLTAVASTACAVPSRGARPWLDARAALRETASTGGRLLVMFLAFSFLGHLLNDLIPAGWITSLFGRGRAGGVPLAATLGLPLYVNTEASLPLVKGLLDDGMSGGAALAFLVTGAGTSAGAVAGTLAIARARVVALIVATLWVGAVACGLAYDAATAAGWL